MAAMSKKHKQSLALLFCFVFPIGVGFGVFMIMDSEEAIDFLLSWGAGLALCAMLIGATLFFRLRFKSMVKQAQERTNAAFHQETL